MVSRCETQSRILALLCLPQDLRIEERFGDIKLSMFLGKKAHNFPCLKGKGAEVRSLVTPLLVACEELMDDSTQQRREMKLLLRLAERIEGILKGHKDEFCWPEAVATTFKDSLYGLVQVTSSLCHYFHERRIILFNFTIKSHYALHLAHAAGFINPRLCWCYAGEDLMHTVQLLATSCAAGTPPHLIAAKVMRKYAQGLSLNLAKDPFR